MLALVHEKFGMWIKAIPDSRPGYAVRMAELSQIETGIPNFHVLSSMY